MSLTLVRKDWFKTGIETVRFGKNLFNICALMSLYAGSAVAGKVGIRNRNQRLGFFTRNIGTYTRRALRAFNFEVQVVGHDADLMRRKSFLLVSNHLSYLDILVLSSIQRCVFVTSVDMKETFFLGTMAELGGSIFIERRNRSRIGEDVEIISETLKGGHHVVLYPEGTSSDGERVLPFKKTLLMSAIRAGADVLPVVLKYTHVNGERFGRNNRDRICWYGEMGFLPHFLGLMSLRKVKVELHFLKPIPVTENSSRHHLAEKTFEAISAVYGFPLGH